MVIRIDIDETICDTPDNPREYNKAIPKLDVIAKINTLHERGHEIIYWTARGSRSGINWYELTKMQLDSWGAKYSSLECTKPYYDVLIDDKSGFMDKLNEIYFASR